MRTQEIVDFLEAKRKEIAGLFQRDTCGRVLLEEIPDDTNTIGGRFEYEFKDPGTRRKIFKLRYIG